MASHRGKRRHDGTLSSRQRSCEQMGMALRIGPVFGKRHRIEMDLDIAARSPGFFDPNRRRIAASPRTARRSNPA